MLNGRWREPIYNEYGYIHQLQWYVYLFFSIFISHYFLLTLVILILVIVDSSFSLTHYFGSGICNAELAINTTTWTYYGGSASSVLQMCDYRTGYEYMKLNGYLHRDCTSTLSSPVAAPAVYPFHESESYPMMSPVLAPPVLPSYLKLQFFSTSVCGLGDVVSTEYVKVDVCLASIPSSSGLIYIKFQVSNSMMISGIYYTDAACSFQEGAPFYLTISNADSPAQTCSMVMSGSLKSFAAYVSIVSGIPDASSPGAIISA